jgi:hypothetical protein
VSARIEPEPALGLADRLAVWFLPWLRGAPDPPCLEPEPEAEP